MSSFPFSLFPFPFSHSPVPFPLSPLLCLHTNRHMRDAPPAQFIDRYLTRPTPHVLKSGASANADVLRIQLTKAQDIIHQLDEKVAEGYVPSVVVVLTVLTC